MFERVVEIIIYVINALRTSKKISEIDTKELSKLGYTSSEISTAFSWLVDKLEFESDLLDTEKLRTTKSFRILNEAERDLFTQEAWGELLQLHSLGLLSALNIETIIEKAVFSEISKVNSEQLKQFVANVTFNATYTSSYGSRLMLNGSDTIN
jgi:uncharacterized protein Smg (DUF494 family)